MTPPPRARSAAALAVAFLAACESPAAPAPCGPIPQVTVNVGGSASVTACFNDANRDILGYTATSSNPSVATASIAGTAITVRAIAPGNAAIIIVASDPGGLQGQQSVHVTVPNRPPQPRGTLASVTVPVGGSATVDVSQHFTEPDGQTLSYAAASSDPAVAAASVAGSVVTITGENTGGTTITVTASDPGALGATQAFPATVRSRRDPMVSLVADTVVRSGASFDVELKLDMEDAQHTAGAVAVAISFDSTLVRFDATREPAADHLYAYVYRPARVRVMVSAPEGLAALSELIALPFRAVGAAGSRITLDAGIVQVIASGSYADISSSLKARGTTVRVRP